MKKWIILASLLLITACVHAPSSSIIGSWIQPISGQNKYQGLQLEADGRAYSLGMKTLLYTSWEQQGDLLILNGSSIGNGGTFPVTSIYRIITLTEDDLVLKNRSSVQSYKRIKNESNLSIQDFSFSKDSD